MSLSSVIPFSVYRSSFEKLITRPASCKFQNYKNMYMYLYRDIYVSRHVNEYIHVQWRRARFLTLTIPKIMVSSSRKVESEIFWSNTILPQSKFYRDQKKFMKKLYFNTTFPRKWKIVIISNAIYINMNYKKNKKKRKTKNETSKLFEYKKQNSNRQHVNFITNSWWK